MIFPFLQPRDGSVVHGHIRHSLIDILMPAAFSREIRWFRCSSPWRSYFIGPGDMKVLLVHQDVEVVHGSRRICRIAATFSTARALGHQDRFNRDGHCASGRDGEFEIEGQPIRQ